MSAEITIFYSSADTASSPSSSLHLDRRGRRAAFEPSRGVREQTGERSGNGRQPPKHRHSSAEYSPFCCPAATESSISAFSSGCCPPGAVPPSTELPCIQMSTDRRVAAQLMDSATESGWWRRGEHASLKWYVVVAMRACSHLHGRFPGGFPPSGRSSVSPPVLRRGACPPRGGSHVPLVYCNRLQWCRLPSAFLILSRPRPGGV